MAITDLTNTTWKFNANIEYGPGGWRFDAFNGNSFQFSIDFTSVNGNHTTLRGMDSDDMGEAYIYFEPATDIIYVWDGNNGWINEAIKTISITGGTDATNATLISWLESNATLQVTDIVVNSTTLETTLHTAGKYCDKNILVKSSDSNLVAENIKKDVSVFGVTGSYAGVDVSDTTATQGDVLSGKYFYGSDGVKTEGTMTNHTETSITLNAGTGDQYVPAGHYSDILTKLVLNSDAASKIKKDEVILGVTGSYAGSGSAIEVATEAEMSNILSSATADDNGKIYRYTGTTGTYVNGALYWLEVPSITLISFTIGGASYQAEEGMTWEEWVNSSYNTGEYYISGQYVLKGVNQHVSTQDKDNSLFYVSSGDLIVNGSTYYVVGGSPGGGGGK